MGALSGYLSRARTRRVLEHLSGDLLDIGCAAGQMKRLAGARISGYAGIDIAPHIIEAARAAHPDDTFWVCNIDDGLPETERRFDSIVMCAVIEHLFNLKTVFQGLHDLLRPGGRIVLTTPTNLGNDVVHTLGARIGLFSRAAHDDHSVIFNRKRLEILACEVGLELERHRLFQLGCNQLAVMRRPKEPVIHGAPR